MASSDEESNSEAEDDSPPPPTKSRSMRKRKKVDYSEDHVKVIPDITSNSPKRRRRRGAGAAAAAAATAAAPRTKKAAKKKSRDEEKDEEDEENIASEKQTKKRVTGRPKKKEGRDRGTLQDRTCPHCKRVFTSSHGRDYHVDHNVCRTDNSKRQKRAKKADQTLFDTLEPGSKFVTPYGVVEVIADNRAKSAAKSPEKDASKKYSVAKGKLEARQRRQWRALSVRNRARRRRLGELYKYHDITQANIFDVYFGGDPRDKASEQEALPEAPPPLKDPLCPVDSYPDRMVECVLIPDERHTVSIEKQGNEDQSQSDGDLDEEASEEKAEEESQESDGGEELNKPNSAPCRMKLFLQRRLLTDEYRNSVDQYVCGDCGQKFMSRPGYVYHAHGQVCVKKNEARGEQTEQLHQSIENRVDSLLARSKEDDRTRRRLQRSAVYPQVWATLGYLAPGEIVFLQDVDDEPAEDDSDGEVSDLENPDDIIWDLRNRYLKQKNRLIGPVYPTLYSYLGFRGDAKRRLAVDEKEKPKKPRKRRRKAPSATEAPKPLPHIIDVRVLADEVDAGRYPSIKRYEGGHSAICDICRDERGTLFNCNFCKSAVHLACIREKHIVKHPEPGDDFFCHKCIQYILVMRTRAEKRRIKKQQDAEAKAGLGKVAQLDPAGEEAVGQDAAVEETEYHKLAGRGQELTELVELLQDARSRLEESVRVKAMNDARRSTLT